MKNFFEKNTSNKSEIISARLYEISDNTSVKNPKLGENLSKSAYEFATENYDKGQRLLEKEGVWNDEIRECAKEANLNANEKLEIPKLSFDGAKDSIMQYAKRIAESGTMDDRRNASDIESIIFGTNRPGKAGIDGIEDALRYIEGCLQTKSALEQQMNPALKKEWEEQRIIRDALFEEKQKRIEAMQKVTVIDSQAAHQHDGALRNLSNLYANAGIGEEIPSRAQFMQKVSGMSEEELFFLNTEIAKITAKFNRTRDSRELDAALSELATKKLTKEHVVKEQLEKDENDITRVRNFFNKSENETVDKIPEDRRGLILWFKDNFEKMSQLSLDEFRKNFTPEVERDFNSYLEKQLNVVINEKAKGLKYPDTVAGVLGNNADLLQRMIALKDGKIIDQSVILKMPFSEVAKKYLNIKIPEDFQNHFSSR
jgi:hypothetical protein